MTLREWLKSENITQDDLAEKLNITQGRVSQIVKSGTGNFKIAVAISDLSNGAVSIQNLAVGEAV